MKKIVKTLLILFLFAGSVFAGGNGGTFDPGKLILDHVKDQHTIHIGPIHIPLPVILMDNGLQIFSSGHFYHNPQAVEANNKTIHYYAYKDYLLFNEKVYKGQEAKFDDKGIITNEKVGLDFSITKNVVGIFLGLIVLFWVFAKVAAGYSKRQGQSPKGIQSFIEPLILFIRDEVAKPSIGKGYEKYMPFLLTIFFFIWVCNILGLIPFLGGLNVTGNIAVTMILATFTFIITHINANKGYWSHIVAPPGVPGWLLPLMIPIEIIGVISKPIVLMLRLFANITAGHIIILAFVCLIFIFSTKFGAGAGYGASVISLAFSIFMNFLELLVAFLQAYVFTLLSALYFGMATEEAHH